MVAMPDAMAAAARPTDPADAAATTGERGREPDLRDAHHLREQRRVAAEAQAVEREPVDVLDREPGVVERGEHRLAGQLERRLGQRRPRL